MFTHGYPWRLYINEREGRVRELAIVEYDIID